jgi:hypothetical protein
MTMLNGKILLFLCTSLLCVCQQSPPIDFFKEDVTIELMDARARVTGDYYFKNMTDTGKRVRFYYPFPVDSNHHFPDTITISHPYEEDSAGLYFWLSIGANSIDSFEITYEQQVEEPFFRYITTTTHAWKRPIKKANFTIITPETLAINANYAFSEIKNIDKYRFYSILIEDFLPEEDLILSW